MVNRKIWNIGGIIKKLLERHALEEFHEVNNHQEELGGSGYSSRETLNCQIQMNKKNVKNIKLYVRLLGLKTKKSEGQLLVENTVQEWYNAKHATSSIFEIYKFFRLKTMYILWVLWFYKYEHKKDGTQICR